LRIQLNAAGQVELELKTPWRDGTTHLVMSPLEFMQRLAAMGDKILEGTKPGDVAFEQSIKLDLVVDLRAARALGLTIPYSVRVSADEVIE
jgi:hypothetical protein